MVVLTSVKIIGSDSNKDHVAPVILLPSDAETHASSPMVAYNSPSTSVSTPSPLVTASNNEQANKPPERAKDQARDIEWASKTEERIARSLRNIPNLATYNSPLFVICGENICEASGQIIHDSSSSNYDLAMTYLNGTNFAESLGDTNALTDSVKLDRNTGVFTVYLSRLRK